MDTISIDHQKMASAAEAVGRCSIDVAITDEDEFGCSVVVPPLNYSNHAAAGAVGANGPTAGSVRRSTAAAASSSPAHHAANNNPLHTAAAAATTTTTTSAVGGSGSVAGYHKLSDKWTLWAHLPHDTDWSVKSYKKIYEFDTVEQALAITEMLPAKLIMNCMLFLMRSGIMPIWEDVRNRNGGCFSYKVANKDVHQAWKQMSYVLVGETISTIVDILPIINGITISPKKNFSILKVWMSNCNYNNAAVIREVEGTSLHGCLFKKHMPEY